MQHNLWEILSGAPWWVYLLFLYLLSIGLRSRKSRTIPVKRLVFLPLIFVVWSIYNFYTLYGFNDLSFISLGIVFLAFGSYLGFLEVRKWKISVDRKKREITIPGNYSTLVLILLIFVLKFYWGYYFATHTYISYSTYCLNIITSALVTGFFVGRAATFFSRYQDKVK